MNTDHDQNTNDIQPLKAPLVPTVIPESPAAEQQTAFFNVPNSGASLLMSGAINSGSDIETLPARKAIIDSSSRHKLFKDNSTGSIYLSREQRGKTITVRLSKYNTYCAPRTKIGKVYDYIIVKINQIAISGRELRANKIEFPVQELVDVGIYKKKRYAMESLQTIFDALSDSKISIVEHKEHGRQGKTSPQKFAYEPLFFHLSASKNGNIKIELNPHFPWKDFCKYYSILPLYHFKLSKRASALLLYIFTYARMELHKRNWVESGHFNLPFRNIQSEMGLPHESTVQQPARDIKNVILNAISEIEENHYKELHNSDLQLTPMPVDITNQKVSDFLSIGYLRVDMNGKFLEYFQNISGKRSKKLKEKSSIRKKAEIQALTEKIKEKDKDKSTETAADTPPIRRRSKK